MCIQLLALLCATAQQSYCRHSGVRRIFRFRYVTIREKKKSNDISSERFTTKTQCILLGRVYQSCIKIGEISKFAFYYLFILI